MTKCERCGVEIKRENSVKVSIQGLGKFKLCKDCGIILHDGIKRKVK